MAHLRFALPPRGTFAANSESDPLRYYYLPLVGRVFQARIELGLSLLGERPRFERLLEVGYGSGILMPTLAQLTGDLFGVDIEPPPEGLDGVLGRLGIKPTLLTADLRKLPVPDEHFDGAVAFSVLEHLKPHDLGRALGELHRVLRPNGRLLVGMPAVHKAMNAMFSVIGFHGIENHHFSSLPDVLALAARDFRIDKRADLSPLPLPTGWAPYGTALLVKR